MSPSGLPGSVFAASVRFAWPSEAESHEAFEVDGAAGDLMARIEQWGLADSRWRLLEQTTFAKGLSHKGARTTIYCYPCFVKLRWREGMPLDAKAYLKAGVAQG